MMHRLILTLSLAAAALAGSTAMAQEPPVIQGVEAWAATPSAAQYNAAMPDGFWPRRGAVVELLCTVDRVGTLDGCNVAAISEDTPGLVEAALSLAPYYKARMDGTGLTAGQSVRARFTLQRAEGGPLLTRGPDYGDVLQAFSEEGLPAKAIDVTKGTLQCTLDRRGRLKRCTATDVNPGSGLVARALVKLARTFQYAARDERWADMPSLQPTTLDGAKIVVPLVLTTKGAAAGADTLIGR